MKKIVIEYDETTGNMVDASGMCIGNWTEVKPFDEIDRQSTVRDLIKLKDAGFSADDIVTMKEGGVI